jgi:hypothetical protein
MLHEAQAALFVARRPSVGRVPVTRSTSRILRPRQDQLPSPGISVTPRSAHTILIRRLFVPPKPFRGFQAHTMNTTHLPCQRGHLLLSNSLASTFRLEGSRGLRSVASLLQSPPVSPSLPVCPSLFQSLTTRSSFFRIQSL